jgi:hypothetical protein
MLLILQLEEIATLLLEVPELVKCYESRDTRFTDLVTEWLVNAEHILASNRLPVTASVATFRASVISAKRGVISAEWGLQTYPKRRKMIDAVAAAALDKANSAIQSAIEDSQSRIAEAERYVRRIIAVAQAKKIPLPFVALESQVEGKEILSSLKADPDLGSAIVHVLGLVGLQDALILIDRCLTDL